MNDRRQLEYSEIHAMGVDYFANVLYANKFEIISVLMDVASNPQVIARRAGETGYFLVRTGIHPRFGALESIEFVTEYLQHCQKLGVGLFFYSQSIANMDGVNDLEKGIVFEDSHYVYRLKKFEEITPFSLKDLVRDNAIPVMNEQGDVSGSVEHLEDGRALLKGSDNSDFSTMLMALYTSLSNTISSSDKVAFSEWAGLPTHTWTNEHRETYALAVMHYTLEGKSNVKKLPEGLRSAADLLNPQALRPLKKPLNKKIRKMLFEQFGGKK